MARIRYTPEQIINKLREAEVIISKGGTAGQACKQIGVTEQTYYRWSKEYGGLRVDQAKRPRFRETNLGHLAANNSDKKQNITTNHSSDSMK